MTHIIFLSVSKFPPLSLCLTKNAADYNDDDDNAVQPKYNEEKEKKKKPNKMRQGNSNLFQ